MARIKVFDKTTQTWVYADKSFGKDGNSVTVANIIESTADGGSNVITFSDGKTITIKNGTKGSTGSKGNTGAQGEKGEPGIVWRGVWTDSMSYSDNDVVYHNGSSYICIGGKNVPSGIEPGTDSDVWSILASIGDVGATGAPGKEGSNGADGVSPTVAVSKSGKVTTVSITDKNGTKTATINDGADGTNGKNGTSATHSWNGTVLTVTSASGTSSADLKGERGNKGDKGDDYILTDQDKEEIAALAAGADVPDYWQAALDAGVEAINTALCTAGRNKSAFLFYTDAHWNYGSQMSPTLLKYLYNHTGMTKTFFGGDIVNNEGTDYDTMEYLWDWRNQLKNLPNHHSVPGNHDDGNATNNLFSEKYVYGYLLAAEETPDIVRGDSGMYYYIDNPAEKTRYLCLDTAYKGVDSIQQDFVKNALLTTPSGWHIVAVSHIWHDTNYDVTPPTVSDINTDASVLLLMFDNYNNRIGAYADCGGWVEFCVGGHTHWDHDSTTAAGIPIILVETDSQHVRSGLGFTLGTTTESSVNGIIADYDNHKIHVVRIGRGESRDITMTNYVVEYKNMIKHSIGADHQPFNGGKGWAGESRIGSGGIYMGGQSADGYVTGYMPVTLGIEHVIRLKNVVFDGSTANDYKYQVAAFNSGFERIDFSSTAGNAIYSDDIGDFDGSNNKLYAPVLDGNNIIQFTIPKWTMANPDLMYIAICCSYLSDDSIITFNEPIE